MKTYLKRLILLITVISHTSCAIGIRVQGEFDRFINPQLQYDRFITTIPDLNPGTGRIFIYQNSLIKSVDRSLYGLRVKAPPYPRTSECESGGSSRSTMRECALGAARR